MERAWKSFTEVFPQLFHKGGEWGIVYRIFQIEDIIYECRSCEIGLNRANSQSGSIRMFCIKSASQVPHPTQLTLLFCLKKVLAAVRGEVAVVQRTSWQDPSQWTDRAKRKNWRSFRGRCWLNKILWLMQHTFSVSRLKFIKKSWTVSESNTSLAWTHWKTESEQGFELEIFLSHSVIHVSSYHMAYYWWWIFTKYLYSAVILWLHESWMNTVKSTFFLGVCKMTAR